MYFEMNDFRKLQHPTYLPVTAVTFGKTPAVLTDSLDKYKMTRWPRSLMSNTVAGFHPVSWLLKLVPGFSEGLNETKNTEKKADKDHNVS